MRILREGSKMKTTGIIMSGDHPKLILDGLKTQTRRIFSTLNKQWKGQQPLEILPMKVSNEWVGLMQRDPNKGIVFKCRFGVLGDRLWVRETWAVNPTMDNRTPRDISSVAFVYYKASARGSPLLIGRWRPSLFMPRWASRILLEITEIRVERLQEITQDDAVAEGMRHPEHAFKMIAGGDVEVEISPKEQFAELWDSLNAKRGYGWDINPWVWVISFKRIDGQR